jgi:hypothetical protein
MWEIDGLPVHVLVVHAVVVLVPLSALVVLLAVFWPHARARLGVVSPLLALGALATVPVAVQAGQWLEQRVPTSALVREHTDLGGTLLPWVVALAVVAVVVWWLDGAGGLRGSRGAGRWQLETPAVRVAVGVLAVVVAAGAVVTVVRVGESGSRAVWDGRLQEPR